MFRSNPPMKLPAGWPEFATAAVPHVIAMARFAFCQAHARLGLGAFERARLNSKIQRLEARLARAEQTMLIKDARMKRIAAVKRPHYSARERMQILELQAACGWSAAQTAKRFLLSAQTVLNWHRELRIGGEGRLLAPRSAINRFPDFVREIVGALAVTYPTMGKRRIADVLCRAGLHLCATTVRRMLESPTPPASCQKPDLAAIARDDDRAPPAAQRTVTARYPHHVWNIDITLVPTSDGFWVPWLPRAVRQSWPFCWNVVTVVDHFSRVVVHVRAFASKPTGDDICRMLQEAAASHGRPPRYTVTDQGKEFQDDYRAWCKSRGVKPRYGAIGKHGSIALIERFHRTLKSEGLRRILVPLAIDEMQRELDLFCRWYNVHRPHRGLHGGTPAEARDGAQPAHRLRGFETRPGYPLDGKMRERRRIKTMMRVEGIELVVDHLEGQRHLPVVELRQAA